MTNERHNRLPVPVKKYDLVDYDKAVSVVKRQVLTTMNRLSVESQKLLALILAQVNPNERILSDMVFVVRVEDYQTLAGVSSVKLAWKHMQAACRELSETRLDIQPEDILDEIPRPGEVNPRIFTKAKLSNRNIGIVDTIDYYAYDREVVVRISRGFEPYIVQVSKYTPFNRDRVITTLKISSDTTMRLYRKLHEFASNKREKHWWSCSLEKFKIEMGLPVDSYADYRNLRRRVIEPALELLNDHSEHGSIKVETKKTGRKITGLTFNYVRKKQMSFDV